MPSSTAIALRDLAGVPSASGGGASGTTLPVDSFRESDSRDARQDGGGGFDIACESRLIANSQVGLRNHNKSELKNARGKAHHGTRSTRERCHASLTDLPSDALAHVLSRLLLVHAIAYVMPVSRAFRDAARLAFRCGRAGC